MDNPCQGVRIRHPPRAIQVKPEYVLHGLVSLELGSECLEFEFEKRVGAIKFVS